MIPTDPAVDMDIQRDKTAVGLIVDKDLHAGRIMVMVKEGDDLADKAHGCFIETPAEGDCSVLLDSPCCAFSKIIVYILGGLPDEVDVFEIAFKRRLFDGRVDFAVIIVVHPLAELVVKLFKSEFFRGKGSGHPTA